MLFPRSPKLAGTDPELLRADLLGFFHASFDRYEKLFEVLADDKAFYKKPISLRHPLIFYYGHTATFFVNKFILAGLIENRINPGFESLFAVGVDEMSWDDLNERHYNWPRVEEVKAYRNQVRTMVDQIIRTAPLSLPIDWNHPWWVVAMGIEHELIHLETSSVLIRQHDLRYVRPHPDWQPCEITGPAPANDLLRIPAGRVDLGRGQDYSRYGWDNEFGRHSAEVAEFQAGRFLVSNGEFLTFVEAAGYSDESYWDEEGRAWKTYSQAEHPSFWRRDGEGWVLRLMLEEVAMRWDWPVEVNYHEAQAFCRWKAAQTGQSVRLPSEDEWHRLHDFVGSPEVAADGPANGNLHLDQFASSCPVNLFQHGELFDVIGNVWQWTETPIYPFEGFKVHPVYDDFTAPTFDDRHNLFKGGSWISCGNEAASDSRYAFRRHFFQHAGFRYVVAEAPIKSPSQQYETDQALAEYLEFHYGDEYFAVPNFMRTLADLAIHAMAGKPARRALDLGCAVGRASFELARQFDQVTGIDFSARFIQAGVALAQTGLSRYTLTDEGELKLYKERQLSELGLDSVAGKVDFYQGDACNLKPIFTGYDLIFAVNLIDRLYSPRQFLQTVHERLNQGGLLLVASPYTWLVEHTPREEWLGGFKQDGENFTTLDGLKALLSAHFRLVQGPLQVPFVIRETRRKFQHSLSETTLWEKI